jgi:hypothetical protein
MPIDFQSISAQVRQWGDEAPGAAAAQAEAWLQASACLEQHASRLGELTARVERAVKATPALRCAIPAGERLNAAFTLPQSQPAATILAADGSQIDPDRHAQLEFCVINVGAFEMSADPATPPREYVTSRLLLQSELHTEYGLISADMVALKRDLSERQYLAYLAGKAAQPVVALTDGPIELFSAPDLEKTPEFKQILADYLASLQNIACPGIRLAGYVDKPGSNLVIRLLELANLPEQDLSRPNPPRQWPTLSDARLFERQLLPGQRSAVFAKQSTAAQSFAGALALRFFYLNVGRTEGPWIVRVETPAWVADDPPALNGLHAALVSQANLLGTKPYPYALHRAHEVACVSFAEKDQLAEMMAAEMRRRGVQPDEISNKQYAKNLAGRTSYR